jgi:hypothetical protein
MCMAFCLDANEVNINFLKMPMHILKHPWKFIWYV